MLVGSAWAADVAEVQKVAQAESPARSVNQGSTWRPVLGELLWECAKSALLAMRGNSLVIFDWDDTLFPTSALDCRTPIQRLCEDNGRQGFLSTLKPSEEVDAYILAAIRVLQVARRHGATLIVTNSDHGWVHDSAAKLSPRLACELGHIPVISARSIFEPQGISDPRQWKALCFQRIVQCFHSSPAGIWGVRSLISVGDGLEEREAAIQVARSCPCYVKSVKFLERPSVARLLQQLELCVGHLTELAEHTGNLDVDLGQVVMNAPNAEEGKEFLGRFLTSAKYGVPPGYWNNGESMPMHKKRRVMSWAGRLGG